MGETQSRTAPGVATTHTGGHSGDYSGAFARVVQQSVAASSFSPFTRTTTRCEEAPPPPPPLDGVSPPPPAPPPLSGGEDVSGGTTTASSDRSGSDAIQAASSGASAAAFACPGPYEQVVHEGKRLVMIDTFDGFRCDINKQVSPFMAVVHSFHLGNRNNMDGRANTYSFLTQVADEAGLLMARVDPGRQSLDGRLHRSTPLGILKLQIGVSPDGQGDQMMADIDVGGATWAGNLKYGSMGGGLIYGINYMQAVHPNVSMGGEGMYIAANQNLLSSYTMRFQWMARHDAALTGSSIQQKRPPQPPGMPVEIPGLSSLCVNFNTAQAALTFNYKQCVVPGRLTLGAELSCNPLTLQSQLLLGGEFQWSRSKLHIGVDGSGRIQSVLEAKYGMAPGSPTIQLSADVDHFKEEMKFGYGINIEE